MKKYLIYIALLIAVLGAGAYFVFWRGKDANKNQDLKSEELAGLQTGSAPWEAETANLLARLKSIGLKALLEEGAVLHTHQHLDLFIDGNQIPVPSGIGIGPAGAFIAPIHTHDSTGIIHVESDIVQDFTLGQFFDIWGVFLTRDCIGSFCSQDSKKLSIFINGNLADKDPREIKLEPRQEIAIVFGSPESFPDTIPSTFEFPEGY